MKDQSIQQGFLARVCGGLSHLGPCPEAYLIVTDQSTSGIQWVEPKEIVNILHAQHGSHSKAEQLWAREEAGTLGQRCTVKLAQLCPIIRPHPIA